MSKLWPLALLLLVGAGLSGLWWIASRTAPPDGAAVPSDVSDARPAGDYVGTPTCAECHPENAALYAHSGHAHTFAFTKDSKLARQLDGRTFRDAARGTQFLYSFDRNGLAVEIPSKLDGGRFGVTYALGSGTHAVTFLTLMRDEDGQPLGVEHRASYYRSLRGLGITPGQQNVPPPSQDVQFFGKLVTGHDLERCIECHTTTGTIVGQHIQNLRPNVGCECCHGPGRTHTEAARHDGDTAAFAVEARWPTAESELRTCGRCHRLPEMLTKTELSRKSKILVRLQPVGLMQSECYRQSNGRLRCTTCHNPHERTSTDSARYEHICLDCHTAPKSTPCPINPRTQCLTCHMPGLRVNASIFHDHWIRIRRDDDPKPVAPPPTPRRKQAP